VAAKEPAPAVIEAARRLGPGLALDIACGAGRHAIWLHQKGWQVTAVDRDEAAIAELQQTFPQIDSRVVDLEQSPFRITPAGFDLIVCWLYLQRDLYPAIATGLRPGGMAALSVLLKGRFAAQPGELESHFPGWQILHQAGNERMAELVTIKPHQQ
jgi:SAM-dependent methyltransferase